MQTKENTYESVIGLEVHAQLLTDSKLFSGDSTRYGAAPNTWVSPITLAHPGTLPKLNRKAIELAIRMGLVCHSEIARYNYFARKNYMYPDLPKGYQISQHTTPICKGGYLLIRAGVGEKKINLTRIHLEEDAGKSIHDLSPDKTCLDFNRAGVPLIEIVSEPDLRSGEEAAAYLTELRKLVRWVGVCDGNMEEGSFRCDANISIRLKGDEKLGTRVEVKNLNSIRNVKKAIEVEIARMTEQLEKGMPISQETKGFDADHDTTFIIRTKEDADDYRYFPEPDLAPFHFTEAYIESVRLELPPLPEELTKKYTREWQLSEYDAGIICEDKCLATCFEAIASHFNDYKAVANWLIGPVKSYLNEKGTAIENIKVSADKWARLLELVRDGKLSFSVAAGRILPAMIENPDKEPLDLAKSMDLIQDANEASIQAWVEAVLQKMPDKVEAYRRGKKGLMGLFVGEVKKISKGKADPKIANAILEEKLNQL